MKRPVLWTCVLFLFLGLQALGAQSSVSSGGGEPYWLVLERGKRLFRSGSYGDSLLAFEDAKRIRRDRFSTLERYLIDLLSVPEVRRFGDSLERVEAYIAQGNQPNAAAALDELYHRFPRNSFNGSVAAVLERIGALRGYPEAEYWIGEVYRIEGEYGVALGQYRRAYELRSLLEAPDFAWELLYAMAEVHRRRGEFLEMERRLNEILSADTLWQEDSRTFVRSAMSRTLAEEGPDRFLILYRYENGAVERAHRLLGFHYYATGRHARSVEHLAFAFLIQNTLLIDELKSKNFDYVFTSYASLMEELAGNRNYGQYMRDVDYYKTAYYLGAGLFASGKRSVSDELWRVVARSASAGEWAGRAQNQLRNPHIEPVVETP